MEQFRLRIGGRTLVLPEGTLAVGRMADCWLALDDDLISRYHAKFHVTGDGVDLEDLESRNGTFVNGKRLSGRIRLHDGDQVRIGHEVVAVLGPHAVDVQEVEPEDKLRRTIGPGEETEFPTLIGQLVEKSLSMGKIKEAERYALALTNQLMLAKVSVEHPTAVSCMHCLIAIAEKSAAGTWIDKIFRLHVVHGWIITDDMLGRVRNALDRIPRVPGTGLEDYERALRDMQQEGTEVPPRLMTTIQELTDAFGRG